MGLEVYYPADIRNALLAAEQANKAAAEAADWAYGRGVSPPAFMAGYQAGHRAALTTLALAFGLLPQSLPEGRRP